MEKQDETGAYHQGYNATVIKLFRFGIIPYLVFAGGIVLSVFVWQVLEKNSGPSLFSYGIFFFGLSITTLIASLFLFYKRSYDWAVTISDANTRKIQENMRELDKKMRIIEEKNKNLEEAKGTMMNLMQDISVEKNRIEEEKVRSEALLGSIGDGVIATDYNGIIQVTNRAAGVILGCSNEDLVGKSFTETIKLENSEGKPLPPKECPITAVLYTRKKITSSLTNSLFMARNNGTKFPAYVVTTPVILKGKLAGATMVFRDISKEWDIDKSKTEFVSLASHQLRTPLSTVGWYAEMLLAGDAGKLNEEQEDYVKEIYNGNKRMVELVNSLLNVSRIELGTLSIESEMINLASVSASMIEEIKPTTDKKNIKIVEEYDKKLSPINADHKLIRIIFQNLLTNAVKYTPEKGKIKVKIYQKDPNVVIEVSDNGFGIPEHQKKQIFTKLFRADNAKEKETEGTGLGLYIIKLIIDVAKGKIWFESEENKGTTFFITLPLTGMATKEGTKSLVE